MLSNWDKNASKKTTFIIPSVSAGNVGQLTADAFISSFDANFVGHVDALDCVLPVFGSNPYSAKADKPNVTAYTGTADLLKSCTLMGGGHPTRVDHPPHYASDKNVLLFQQRSELIAWKKKEYLTRLINWLKEENFRCVVLLCGCFAYARTDKELNGSKLRYLLTPEAEKLFPNVIKDEFLLEKRSPDDGHENDYYHLPGGGVAEAFYSKCIEEKLPLIIFLNYINEGDNYQDALDLAKFCDDTLKLRPKSNEPFVGPPSWLEINL